MNAFPQTEGFSEGGPEPYQPVLKVIGLGGGGCNAIARMMELGLHGLEFIAANTDHQALLANPAPVKIQLGPTTTRGLGAGGNPEVGRTAAEESWRELAAALKGADMVFLTAGMGGGTGTGSIPVAAKIARSLGAVTIAIVTTPFSFEMGRRQINSGQGLDRLRKETNTLVSIPNDRLLDVAPRDLPMEVAFHLADDVLRQAVEGISELITTTGLINVDFSHIRRLISLGGGAIMSIGHGHGENKVQKAVQQALNHPLLETMSLENAAGVIANFTGGVDMALNEIFEAMTFLQTQTGPQTDIVMGALTDEFMENRVQVTLVVTGLGAPTLEETMANIQKPQTKAEAISQALNAATEETKNVQPPPPPPETRQSPSRLRTILASQDLSNAASQNLDLPAFLRRQTRFASGQS